MNIIDNAPNVDNNKKKERSWNIKTRKKATDKRHTVNGCH